MKQYTIKVRELENGDISIKRINNGFNAFELLGFLELSKNEIIENSNFGGIKEGTKIITEREVKTKKT